MLQAEGIDLIDVSSGGNDPRQQIPAGPGYQVGNAERIRRETGLATGAVGFITEPAQADQILRTGQADVVLLAREMLRDPYWPLHAAQTLSQTVSWPVQYARAASGEVPRREPLKVFLKGEEVHPVRDPEKTGKSGSGFRDSLARDGLKITSTRQTPDGRFLHEGEGSGAMIISRVPPEYWDSLKEK